MSRLDATVLRQSIRSDSRQRLEELEVFAEIDSTNTYLLQRPGPPPGMFRVALADHQTAGRGRRNRGWVSPPDSGLYLSFAYTFAAYPRALSALTLAIGMAVIDALAATGVKNVLLKWPNDLVLDNAKLGGILTEVQHEGGTAITVVTGIGLNIELPAGLDIGLDSEWAQRATDLSHVSGGPPDMEALAAGVVDELASTCVEFESGGFARFVDRWPAIDWLLGKDVVVDDEARSIEGMAAGVDRNGALLVQTESGERRRVLSGSIRLAQA